MGLLQECPKCKKRMGIGRKACRCGFKLGKASGKVYWIDYYVNDQKKRERIGPNKAAAEQRLREALKLRAEERYIDKDPATRITLGELCDWYLKLPEVKAKDSYGRDQNFIQHLKRLLGENIKIKNLTPGRLESYQQQRLQEKSPRRLQERSPGEEEAKVGPEPGNGGEAPKPEKANTSPGEVNRETACLKAILNRAVRHGKLKYNPIRDIKKLPENNTRMRILTHEEFNKLLEACPIHIQPIVLIAHYMGLRRSEILFLTWPEIDLQKGFIRLSAERTKTDQSRVIPIHPRVKEALERLPRGLHTKRLFLFDGQPFEEFRRSFKTACKKAKIQNFVFHDLRHCALNNLRLAGNDYFKIMAISGHKTMSCFKRYNLVTEEELTRIIWPVGTYVGTNEKGATANLS